MFLKSSFARQNRNRTRFVGFAVSSLLFIGVPTIAFAAPIDVSTYELNFGADDGERQTFVIGEGAGEGFTYTYNDVHINDVTIDAVVTVLEIDNIDSDDNQGNGANNKLDEFDDSSSTGREIDLYFDVFGDSSIPELETGYVTYRIDFFDGYSLEPLSLDGLTIGVTDVDDNQFVQFYGATSYSLSDDTQLVLDDSSPGVLTFTEPLGTDDDVDSPQFFVEVGFGELSYVVIRAGANQSGSAGISFLFEGLEWEVEPTPVAVALVAHDLDYDLNGADGIAPESQSSTTDSALVTIDDSTADWEYGSCVLGGWNTRSDGRGVLYLDGDEIYLTDDITLYADWDCPSTGDASSAESSNPGIFLTVTGQAGRAFEGSDVVFGSYAVAPNSSYQLLVQSISNPSLINKVLATGHVNSGGHLERTIALPRLVAGSYKIILTGTGASGERLKLTNHINVDSAGKFTSVSAERLQPLLP